MMRRRAAGIVAGIGVVAVIAFSLVSGAYASSTTQAVLAITVVAVAIVLAVALVLRRLWSWQVVCVLGGYVVGVVLMLSPRISAPGVAFVSVLTLIAIAASVVLLVPRRQVRRWREEGIAGKDLAELENATRTTLVQAIGGLALIATVSLTAYQASEARRSSDRNLSVAQQSQATDLLSRAIEQLGAIGADGKPALDVRIGALSSLQRVADIDAGGGAALQVSRILLSYIRLNLPKGHTEGFGRYILPHVPNLRVSRDVPSERISLLPWRYMETCIRGGVSYPRRATNVRRSRAPTSADSCSRGARSTEYR